MPSRFTPGALEYAFLLSLIKLPTYPALFGSSGRATSRGREDWVVKFKLGGLVIWYSCRWRVKCVSIDISEVERENDLLISLLVWFNGEKRCNITLWILFLIEDNGDSVAAWKSRRLPNRTGASFFCQIDNVIPLSFHRFDFKKDAGYRCNWTVSACTIVGDDLEEIRGLCNQQS
jgi:hypothetical protein